MRNYELKTTIVGYEKEVKEIANIAKSYGVSEAIVLRCLLASAEGFILHNAINHFSKKETIELNLCHNNK